MAWEKFPHILRVLHGWVRVGGACQAMADGKTKTETLQAMWPETLRKPVPRFPALCEKNVFRFFRF